MTPSQTVENLCQHLKIASTRLSAVNGSIWSSYDSGTDIAQFILSCLSGIRAGILTLEQKKELWGIFAPTSDWDDVVGAPH